MRRTFAATALALAAIGSLAATADARPRPTGEERLAKLIDGRTAGEPQSCIFTPGSSDLTVIDKTAIVYKSAGKIWVNRTAYPEDIDEDDILVIKRFSGSSLCRQDQITLADRYSGVFSGVIFLSDFVPYEKAS